MPEDQRTISFDPPNHIHSHKIHLTISFDPPNHPVGWVWLYSHFTDEEIESQRSKVCFIFFFESHLILAA